MIKRDYENEIKELIKTIINYYLPINKLKTEFKSITGEYFYIHLSFEINNKDHEIEIKRNYEEFCSDIYEIKIGEDWLTFNEYNNIQVFWIALYNQLSLGD